jgi:hypothetical protein
MASIKHFYLKFVFFFFIVLTTPSAFCEDLQLKSKVNLEDVKIEGQTNKSSTGIIQRDRLSLEKKIKKRSSYKNEILEYLPDNFTNLNDKTTN